MIGIKVKPNIIVRSMYNFVNCLQFNIRYEKFECPAPVCGALWYSTSYVMVFYMFNDSRYCSFCWNWRNCWLLLFKFSFLNEQIHFQILMNVYLLRVCIMERVTILKIDINVNVHQVIVVSIVKLVSFNFWKYIKWRNRKPCSSILHVLSK